MSETIQNNRELRKNKSKEICRIFDENITDKNIQQYIFGKNGYSADIIRNSDNGKYVQYMNNILSLTFYFVYACYKYDMDNNDTTQLSNHNSKRVINSLRNAFVKFPVTQELIQFVLTDIQFDLARGESSELSEIFGGLSNQDISKFTFNPYFKLLAEYNKNPGRFQYSSIKLMDLFIGLLKNLTFLGEYKLESYSVDSFAFVLLNGDSESTLPIEHIMFRDDEHYFGGIYNLFSIDREEKNSGIYTSTIRLKYLTPSGDRSLVFSVPDEDNFSTHLNNKRPKEIFNEITGQSWEKETAKISFKKNSINIDQIHTVNYKYIKNLALAVSDAISSNEGTKKVIYDRFHRHYPYIFEKPNLSRQDNTINSSTPYDDENLDWDTIVIMLLIEESPTVVLEYIIRKCRQTFYYIAQNLYKRSYDTENLSIFCDALKSKNKLNLAVNEIINEKLIIGESAGFGKIPSAKTTYDKLFPRAAAMLILSKLTMLQENEVDDSLVYTGNLRSNISLLQSAKSEADAEKTLKYSCIILGETFKHLICFYSGLFEYGKAKHDYEVKTYGKCLKKSDIIKYQKAFEKTFISAAHRKAGEFKNCFSNTPESAIDLMKKFIDFCKDCKLSNNFITDNSKNLYSAVGRYEIANIRVLEDMVSELEQGSTDKYNYNSDVWINTTLTILEYLKTGSLPDTPIDSNLFNAIYPFTAVFNRGKENSDGYKTVNFSLNIDIDDDANPDFRMDINVLSEFSYNRSDVYYCLPNILRSNHKWWIDPVLISFKEFNDIFSDSGKDV